MNFGIQLQATLGTSLLTKWRHLSIELSQGRLGTDISSDLSSMFLQPLNDMFYRLNGL